MMSAVTAVLYVIKDIAAVCAILVIFRYLFLNEVSLKKKVGLPTISALIIFNAFFGVFAHKRPPLRLNKLAALNALHWDIILDFIHLFGC